jgi:hypothetical protein
MLIAGPWSQHRQSKSAEDDAEGKRVISTVDTTG